MIELALDTQATEKQLLHLGAIVANLKLRIMLGVDAAGEKLKPKQLAQQAAEARAAIAGILLALKKLLPDRQFANVLEQWDLDHSVIEIANDISGLVPSETDQSIMDEADRLVRQALGLDQPAPVLSVPRDPSDPSNS